MLDREPGDGESLLNHYPCLEGRPLDLGKAQPGSHTKGRGKRGRIRGGTLGVGVGFWGNKHINKGVTL